MTQSNWSIKAEASCLEVAMDVECSFVRVEGVSFPEQISSLTHVLELIDEFLMTYEEALMKATRTNDLPWVDSLLVLWNGDVTDAIEVAASNGHEEMVDHLLLVINKRGATRDDESDEDSSNSSDDEDVELRQTGANVRQFLQKAIGAAATNGQLNVVRTFLPQLAGSGHDAGALHAMYRATWQALDRAAANGQHTVVQFVVDYASKWGYIDAYAASSDVDAFGLAIRGGNEPMANYLLRISEIQWNMKNAFKLAMENVLLELAEWIYVLHSQYIGGDGGELLVECVRGERVDSVKYLCANFQFSSQAYNQSFRIATRALVTYILLTTGCILDGSITVAFRNVTRCGVFDGEEYYPSDEQVEIARVLGSRSCVPPRVIKSALVGAATNGHEKLLNVLRDDDRINAQTITKAFIGAATKNHLNIVKASCDEAYISSQVVTEAFLQALKRGCDDIIRFLLLNPSASQLIKDDAVCKWLNTT